MNVVKFNLQINSAYLIFICYIHNNHLLDKRKNILQWMGELIESESMQKSAVLHKQYEIELEPNILVSARNGKMAWCARI